MVRVKAQPRRLPAADTAAGRWRLAAVRGGITVTTTGAWTDGQTICDVCGEGRRQELVLWCPACRRHAHPGCQPQRPAGEIWTTGGPWWICADCARWTAVEEHLTGRSFHARPLEITPPPPDADGRPGNAGLKRNRFSQDRAASRTDDSDDSRPPGPDDRDDNRPYKKRAVDPTPHASI